GSYELRLFANDSYTRLLTTSTAFSVGGAASTTPLPPGTATRTTTATPLPSSTATRVATSAATATPVATTPATPTRTATATATAIPSATPVSGGSSCPSGQYLAEYFPNQTLSGTPTFTRCEAGPINYQWGTGGPGNGLGSQFFSVRWTGQFDFGAGYYQFTATTDDGMRVLVDGSPVIDAWRDQGVTTYQATSLLAAGSHQVKVEYYNKWSPATAQVSWQAAGGTSCPSGQYLAEYYNNQTLSGTPAFTRCEAG